MAESMTGSHIRRKKMQELKVELGQIGMRRGSLGSVTSTPTDIRHVDEWRMDLTAAEKRRLQQAKEKASAIHQHRPRFYLDQKNTKVMNFYFNCVGKIKKNFECSFNQSFNV